MQTPFEAKNGEQWTTLQESNDFIHALAASTPRAQVIQLGRSVQGRPIYALAVGEPTPRLLSRPVAMHVGGQHGNEHTGYESAIAHARDLTTATDPATVAYLEQCTWLVIPSASPDTMGLRKYNYEWVDLNRDHVNRVTPEARAIAWALHTYKPTLTLDSHSAVMSYDFVPAYPNDTLGNHPDVVATSKAAMEAGMAALQAEGRWVVELTGSSKNLREVLTNAAAFAHSPTVLLETSREADPLVTMADAKTFIDAVQAHHAANLADYVAASQASRSAIAPPIVAQFV